MWARINQFIYLTPRGRAWDPFLSPPFFSLLSAPEQHGGQDEQGEQGDRRPAARTEQARTCRPVRRVAGPGASGKRQRSRRTGRPKATRTSTARPMPMTRMPRAARTTTGETIPPPCISRPLNQRKSAAAEVRSSFSISNPAGLPTGLELRPRTVPASWQRPSPEGSA